jgi:hypothetical protein
MGWSFNNSRHGASGKAALINELTKNEENKETGLRWTIVNHRLGAKIRDRQPLWSVWDFTKYGQPVTRYIRCDLLSYGEQDGWGYKHMDESFEPDFYDCPESFLAITPVKNQAWRDEVVKHHAERQRCIKAVKSLNEGDQLTFRDLLIDTAIFVGKFKRSLVINVKGRSYRLVPSKFNHIAAVTPSQRLA